MGTTTIDIKLVSNETNSIRREQRHEILGSAYDQGSGGGEPERGIYKLY